MQESRQESGREPRQESRQESLYEYAGGEDAMLRLAAAHHARCLEDPELNHPFSHPDQNPRHVERLAWYWGEVLGGPPRFSDGCSDQSALTQLHVCHEELPELGRRFLECFVVAMDDAGLPDDPVFRTAMRAYMQWAVDEMLTYMPGTVPVPEAMGVPHWTWTGLTSSGAPSSLG